MDILKIKTLAVLLITFTVMVSSAYAQYSNGEQSISAKDIRTAFKESYKYEKSGNLGKAIDVLVKVYDGNSYEINLRLGYLYNLNKQYNESINCYNAAISLMPLSIEARLGISNPLAAVENWTTLEQTYNDILKIDPNNSQANYLLGMMFYYRADYNGAYNYIERTANLYPFDYYSTLMLGWTNLKLGRNREAEVLFNKVLLISPDDSSALDGLSSLKKK